MKIIGREVCFLQTGANNPRNGECSFLRLRDGAILMVFTEYYGEHWFDDATARISAVISRDEGETWSERFVLIEKDPECLNIMSPSLVRLPDGDVGICYLYKIMSGDVELCMPVFRRSSDEGKTWSDWRYCTDEEGYYCGVNDSAVVLSGDRIVWPMSSSLRNGVSHTGEVIFLCSSDGGASWHPMSEPIATPYSDPYGFAEPGILALPDGRLWSWFRSPYGYQYHAYSSDNGGTWSDPVPNFYFSSPDSPMRVKNVGNGITAAVFNPISFHCCMANREAWGSPKRTPLVCAVSRNGGLSFDPAGKTFVDGGFDDFINDCYLLEDDRSEAFCYGALIGVKDGFLAAYYCSNGSKVCLNCTRIRKIRFDEL